MTTITEMLKKLFLIIFFLFSLPFMVFGVKSDLVDCVNKAYEYSRSEKTKKEALALFKEALTYKPVDGDDYTALGTAYYYLGKDDKAIQAYKKAIELEPGKSCAYDNLSSFYIYKKMYSEAKKIQLLCAGQINPKAKGLVLGMFLNTAVEILGPPERIQGNTNVGTCLPTPSYTLKDLDEANTFSQGENNWVVLRYPDGIEMRFEKGVLTNVFGRNSACDVIGRRD